VMDVLPTRFAKYGLTIHPEKTRMVMFVNPESEPPKDHNRAKRETFSFLGFTHYWGKSRKGNWVIKRSTEKGRFARALKKVSDWCRWNRHLPISEQLRQLTRKLTGHYAYYGITGNFRSLANFRAQVTRVWRKWLSRRSRSGRIAWEKFHLLMQRYTLPPVRIVLSVFSVNL